MSNKIVDISGLERFFDNIKNYISGILSNKQDKLVSGTNIKTINGESIIGEGDLTVEGGAKVYTWNWDSEGEEYILSQEEYDNILDADIIVLNIPGIISGPIAKLSEELIEFTGECILQGRIGTFDIYIKIVVSAKLATLTIKEQEIPTKTSQLENDSNFVSSDNLKTINGQSIVGSGDLTTDIVVASKEELEALDVPSGTRARIFTEIPETTYNNLNLGRILNYTETNPLPFDFYENITNYTFNIEVDTSVTFPYDETAEYVRVTLLTNAPMYVYINETYDSIQRIEVGNWGSNDIAYMNGEWNNYSKIREFVLNSLYNMSQDELNTLMLISSAFNGYIYAPATFIVEEYTKTEQTWVKTSFNEQEQSDYGNQLFNLILAGIQESVPTKTSQLENDSNFVSSDNFKTINGQSLIGSGDLTIEGGSSEANVAAVDDDNSTLDDVETNNYKKEIVTINSETITLLPDKYYKNTGTFSALDISLEDSLDTTHISEYCLEFTTASSGTSLSVPDTIKWANGIIPDLENNCIYQLSIMNNLGICTKFI